MREIKWVPELNAFLYRVPVAGTRKKVLLCEADWLALQLLATHEQERLCVRAKDSPNQWVKF